MNAAPPQQRLTTGLVTIVIPAKDEAAAIGDTLRTLPISTLQATGFQTEIVVLDGHSVDGTRDIAYGYDGGVTVVFERERGKGSAVRNARPMLRGDYVVMIDADGTYASDAIPRMLGPLAWGEADVVMGTRHAQAGALSGAHRIGNALLSLAARILYERPCPDLCTGLWAFRSEALRVLPLTSTRFELEAEMFAMASRMGMRVAHVPVDYLPRKGQAKLSSVDGVRIGLWLLRSRVVGLNGNGLHGAHAWRPNDHGDGKAHV